MISNDPRAAYRMTGAPSAVAFKRLRMLHMRLNPPEH
jgi:hypothetical protein